MQIPGHLALALAQSRLLPPGRRNRRTLIPLLIASLFPDVVDKSIGYLFHLMPNGRHYMHNIFSLVGFSWLVTLIWGQEAGRGWFMGHLGHLLADSSRWLPWFFPFKSYSFRPGRLRFDRSQLARESLLLGVVLVLYRLSR